MHLFAQEKEARAQHRFVEPLFRVEARLGHQITSNMLGNHLVVGHIGVQRADHIIAVLPGVGGVEIELMTAGLGITHQIQPMTTPVLAKAGRRQQAVDLPLQRTR